MPRVFSSLFHEAHSKAIVTEQWEFFFIIIDVVENELAETINPVATITLRKLPRFPLKPLGITERLIISRVHVTIPTGARLLC